MKVLKHQRESLDEIVARARAFYAGQWKGLRLQCRWHTLMVGGTGVGKSTLGTLASKACSAVPIRVSTLGFIPVGAHNRGARETMGIIAEHVAKNPRTFLIVDELDKLVVGAGGGTAGGSGSGGSADTWQSYIRAELLEIADGRWPTGMNLPELDGPDISIEELTIKLRETVFLLGIGTFQSVLESASRRTIGFSGETAATSDGSGIISNDTVTALLGRELGNRFHSQLVRLPELRPEDYHSIALEAELSLPENLQKQFRREVANRVNDAIENKKSVRFLEEALSAVMINMLEPERPELTPTNQLTLNDL